MIVTSERGENFRVGDVVEIGVVLASEGLAKRWWDQNPGREIGTLVEGQAIAQ
jgi:hypothetical protein